MLIAFRNELLEELLAKPGQSVDINHLVEKYCGTDTSFPTDDNTLAKQRLRINDILRELNNMGWITLYPTYGLSSGHRLNHATGRRQFILIQPVIVKLTMKGEIEYNRLKAEAKVPLIKQVAQWLLNHVVAVIIIGLLLAFLIFKLGWN